MSIDYLVMNSRISFSFANALTRHCPVEGSVLSTTEPNATLTIRGAFTAKKLLVTVTSNSLSGGSNTSVWLRLNAANSALTVSITNGTTGTFEDTVNTVAIASGDAVVYRLTTGGTSGTITFNVLSMVFTASGTVALTGAGTNAALGFGDTKYLTTFGRSSANITENNRNSKIRTATTLSKLITSFSTNSLDAATTVRMRKNNSNGNQSVSVTAGSTGDFEDSSNTDSFVDGDYSSIQMSVAGTTGSAVVVKLFCISSLTNYFTYTSASVTGGSTTYFPLNGANTTATESDVQLKTRVTDSQFRDLYVYIDTNTCDASSTASFRVNGANSVSVSIGATLTGEFESRRGVVTASTDLINFMTTGGGTGSISVAVIGIHQTPAKAQTSSLSGSTGTISGTIAKSVLKSLVGGFGTLTGTVSKAISHSLVGISGSLSGTISKKTLKSLTGNISSFSSDVIKLINKVLSGAPDSLLGTITSLSRTIRGIMKAGKVSITKVANGATVTFRNIKGGGSKWP